MIDGAQFGHFRIVSAPKRLSDPHIDLYMLMKRGFSRLIWGDLAAFSTRLRG
jgi:hypothetical protein